jgi:hypothetical protein
MFYFFAQYYYDLILKDPSEFTRKNTFENNQRPGLILKSCVTNVDPIKPECTVGQIVMLLSES